MTQSTFAFYGYLSWPRQSWSSRFTALSEGLPVNLHFFRGQLPQYARWQQPFDKHVLLQDNTLA